MSYAVYFVIFHGPKVDYPIREIWYGLSYVHILDGHLYNYDLQPHFVDATYASSIKIEIKMFEFESPAIHQYVAKCKFRLEFINV